MSNRKRPLTLSLSALCLGLASCAAEPTNDSGTAGSGASGGAGSTTSDVGGGAGVAGTAAGGTSGNGQGTSGSTQGTGGDVQGGSGAGGTGAGGATGAAGASGTAGAGATDAGGSGAGGGNDAGAAGAAGTDSASGAGGTDQEMEPEVEMEPDVEQGGAGGADDTGEPEVSTEPELHIYLAVGQSNMQGAAFLPDEPVFHERVQVLQDQNCPESDGNPYGYGQWREMFPPLIKCKEGERSYPGMSGPIGLGPADSFAVAMAEAAPDNVTIGIVGAAYGDTSIQMHLPNCSGSCLPSWGSNIDGAPVVNGVTHLYDWVVDLGKKAQEVGVIKGIIFHQGENNAGDSSWLGNVDSYVTSLRNDLGLDPADCPFVAGELPYTGGSAASHNPIVQQIPGAVENGHYVSAGPMEDGTVLGDRGDGIHWSTFSVIEMGQRYAAKMLEAQASGQ